jgi:GntR family transcriptional regulator
VNWARFFKQSLSFEKSDLSKFLKAYNRSRVPLYIQVASVLRQRIESGQWVPGEKISTLEELESEFHVARVTVRQAVDVLREEGLLRALQGRGTFVSKKTQDRHWLKLAANWTSLVASLKDNVPRNITLEQNCSPPVLGPDDGALAESYVGLRSLQYRNNEPYSVVDLCLARRIYDLDPRQFMKAAALVTIDARDDIDLRGAHQTLLIGSASPEIADLMKIPLGAPTVESLLVVIDDTGEAIYVGDIIYRADCIKLQVDLLGSGIQTKDSNGRKK